jgi:tetratricopeptide (TPR) repeat protein
METQKPERAVEELNTLLASAPNDHEARYFLGGAYEERKMTDEALREYERIPNTSSLYGSAQVRAGYILKSQGKTAEAIERARKALAAKRNEAALYGLLAALYEADGKLAEAETILKEGLAATPKSTDLRYRLGMLYDKMGRSDEGIREMEEILKQDPDNPEALNFIGYSWADRGIKLDEAEVMIKKALSLKPGDGFITDSLGWVYFRKNRIDEAIRYLKEAAAILPEDAAIADHLGDAYAKAGKPKDALEQYQKALKLKPDMKGLQEKIDRLEAKAGGKK